jgi:hypothetical protein
LGATGRAHTNNGALVPAPQFAALFGNGNVTLHHRPQLHDALFVVHVAPQFLLQGADLGKADLVSL